jgi:hypothetical protein
MMWESSDEYEMSNEKLLFLLNRYTGIAPYSHDFVIGNLDSQILSGFVAAMSSFMGEVTGLEEMHLKTVYTADSTLLVEGWDWVIGVLAVSRETTEVRSKLRSVVREFGQSYASLKDADGIPGGILNEFDEYVRHVFVHDRLSPKSVIFKTQNLTHVKGHYELPSVAFNVAKILHYTRNGTSLGELTSILGNTLEQVKHLVSQGCWRNAIRIKFVPTENDILMVTDKSSSTLFSRSNPLELSSTTIRVVGALNGRSSLSLFIEEFDLLEKETVMSELGDLINKGFVQTISIERRLALMNECVLNELLVECANAISITTAKEYFKIACDTGIANHPWIGRIHYEQERGIKCMMDDSMTPHDLDEMYDAINFIIRNIVDQLSVDIGQTEADAILQSIRESCRERWSPLLYDVIS